MSKMAKKFFGLSIFYWALIIIVFLFVTGIVRVSFVLAENFNSGSGNSGPGPGSGSPTGSGPGSGNSGPGPGSGSPTGSGPGSGSPIGSGNSKCKKNKYNESQCNKRKGCSWTIDKYTGSGKCMCCKPDN